MKPGVQKRLAAAARELLRVMEETIVCAGGDPANSLPCLEMRRALQEYEEFSAKVINLRDASKKEGP